MLSDRKVLMAWGGMGSGRVIPIKCPMRCSLAGPIQPALIALSAV